MTTVTTEISSDCFVRRFQIPSPYTSPFPTTIPNQLNSTLSSLSSQYSSDEEAESQEIDIRSRLELEDYMNDSTLSVDGEFDVRVDILGIKQISASISSSPLMIATAPPLYPLSDYESDDVVQHKKSTITTPPVITTPPYKETCIICYEEITDVTTEESKIYVSDFCRTCKYTVHLDCIDEYRVNKLNDTVAERGGESIASSSVGIKCLMCSLEVERIYVRRNGNIDIVKNQIAQSNNDPPPRLSPQQRLQRDLHNHVLNNMERRMRRERRNRFKQKCCNFCFFVVLAISVTVILIMRFA
jgi:hypothetical protein